MGGKRGSKDPLDLEKGFKKISSMLETGRNITLVCAEKDPTRCHRSFLLSPYIRKKGLEIYHILDDGSLIIHQDLEKKLLEEFCPEYKQISFFAQQPTTKQNKFDNIKQEKMIEEAFKKRLKAKHKKIF